MESIINELHSIGAIKFGEFVLKSGLVSPIYFDLRGVISYPKLMNQLVEQVWCKKEEAKFDYICGVPYTALPLASVLSVQHNVPMLLKRKEAKDYGTKKMVEGIFQPGNKCLVVEDVITSGNSVLETVKLLRDLGLEVEDVILVLDREQGGIDNLLNHGVRPHVLTSASEVLNVLNKAGKISDDVVRRTLDFLHKNPEPIPPPAVMEHSRRFMPFSKRVNHCVNPVAKKLLEIIEEKKTNLCVSADVTTTKELLELAEKVGPEICVLKTHMDIIKDFSGETACMLVGLAMKHNFLLLEDRKFADIGNTVKMQYTSGKFFISSWADLVTVHTISGPGVLQALKEAAFDANKPRGCVIIGELSSAGNLITADYSSASMVLAAEHFDFVSGFVSQNSLSSRPGLIHFTPGVSLGCNGDNLGQQYSDPDHVVTQRGSDVIIVGRGIIMDANPGEAARKYKEAAWAAYEKRLLAAVPNK
ncbi:uncharacterized protein LOC136040205 [Artemia franciscana]|uniref:Uridine 5'-monophosphate synthase n=1 Tax=Artemia franciscana TaxID=6661 RepID=A0AA88HMW6_ARTSF|nr:hypothetical protein QYM36_008617 [Artemia franciscana]